MLNQFFDESARVIVGLNKHIEIIEKIANHIEQVNNNGGKILIAGNGGSCADAMHFAGELSCTFKSPSRKAFNAISLTSNPVAITAWTNDFGFESFYSRQVQAFGKSGDLLFLISTGGGDREKGYSMNLVSAAETAKKFGLTVVSLIGKSGGELKKISDVSIVVTSSNTAHIQQAHITIIHAICELLERGD
jgi:D-sedoheptulose 7-phosphate isomerase